MRILVTGKGGKAGSWKVRGEQLGGAIGAEVVPMATLGQIRSADLIVVVKRTPAELLSAIRASGRPWVYDVVDGWPQPAGNAWQRDVAQRWLTQRLADLEPDAVVFPTIQMLVDSDWRGRSMVLPHHAWPKYQARAVRPTVTRVGYEGDPRYLGRWERVLRAQCDARGWEFVVNGDLGDCDIGVALRDASGYPAGAWKSNCKLANLQALGLPTVCSPEVSYRQFGSGAEWWIGSAADVARAFEAWSPAEVRAVVSEKMQAAAPRLADVAASYRGWLGTLSKS
jgi:hypothetical protein